jgi:chaperonin GroES
MDLIPINERLIVIPKTIEKTNLYLPQNVQTKEKPEVGFIIAMDEKIENPKCKIGDKIVFNRYAVTDIEYKNKKYLVMLESAVLAIFKNVDDEERKKYMEGKGDEEYRA